MSEKIYSVDVIIPTLNGGERFAKLLEMLARQQYAGKIGVILVDSGSSDDTLSIARRYNEKSVDGNSRYNRLSANTNQSDTSCGDDNKVSSNMSITIIEIPSGSFTHSSARNIGAEASGADILLFMTQDALPNEDNWIEKIVQNLTQGYAAVSCAEDTTGCDDIFYILGSRQYQSYIGISDGDRECSYTGSAADDSFTVNTIPDEDYNGSCNITTDPETLRINSSLNNVTTAIWHDIFDKYRFEGKYAEDLSLGKRLIMDGHKLKLLSSVRVNHYHVRKPMYFLKRQYVETVTVNNLFETCQSLSDCADKEAPLNNAISYPQAAWLVCQSLGGLYTAFEKIKKYERLPIKLYLFILRQLLKKYENKRLECPEIQMDPELDDFYKLFIQDYNVIPFKRNAIMDIRGYIKYQLEPYIKEIHITSSKTADNNSFAEYSIQDIKECIIKELARNVGGYLARTEKEPQQCAKFWGEI